MEIRNHFLEKAFILGGLGDDDDFLQRRKAVHLAGVGDNDTGALRITQKTDYFRMVLISDNNRGISLAGIFSDNGLDLDDPWTGGINNKKAGLF